MVQVGGSDSGQLSRLAPDSSVFLPGLLISAGCWFPGSIVISSVLGGEHVVLSAPWRYRVHVDWRRNCNRLGRGSVDGFREFDWYQRVAP